MADGESSYNSRRRQGEREFESVALRSDNISWRYWRTSVNIYSVALIYIPHRIGNMAAVLMNSAVNERVRGSKERRERERRRERRAHRIPKQLLQPLTWK